MSILVDNLLAAAKAIEVMGEIIITRDDEITRLRAENEQLKSSRKGALDLAEQHMDGKHAAWAKNAKLKAALINIRDNSLELFATGEARAALNEGEMSNG